MPRWKELPSSLDERGRNLIIQMRRLKDRSGLSLASLESKTGYSRASWERYFNGKVLPPRQAVEALARVVGVEPTRLLVLHEMAGQARQERLTPSPSAGVKNGSEQEAGSKEAASGGPGSAAEAVADPGKAPGASGKQSVPAGAVGPAGVRRSVVLAAVVAAAIVGMGTGTLIAASSPRHDGTGQTAQRAVASPHPSSTTKGPGPYVYKMGKTYPCNVRRTHGKGGGLSAGYSTTRTALLAGPGWDVVEAQCLLGYHKMDPGIVDGVYGQQTIAAVARLQEKAGLPVDGIAGPDTWRVLRR